MRSNELTIRYKFVSQNLKLPLLVCSDAHPSNFISPKCRFPAISAIKQNSFKIVKFRSKLLQNCLKSPEFRKTYAKILRTPPSPAQTSSGMAGLIAIASIASRLLCMGSQKMPSSRSIRKMSEQLPAMSRLARAWQTFFVNNEMLN